MPKIKKFLSRKKNKIEIVTEGSNLLTLKNVSSQNIDQALGLFFSHDQSVTVKIISQLPLHISSLSKKLKKKKYDKKTCVNEKILLLPFCTIDNRPLLTILELFKEHKNIKRIEFLPFSILKTEEGFFLEAKNNTNCSPSESQVRNELQNKTLRQLVFIINYLEVYSFSLSDINFNAQLSEEVDFSFFIDQLRTLRFIRELTLKNSGLTNEMCSLLLNKLTHVSHFNLNNNNITDDYFCDTFIKTATKKTNWPAHVKEMNLYQNKISALAFYELPFNKKKMIVHEENDLINKFYSPLLSGIRVNSILGNMSKKNQKNTGIPSLLLLSIFSLLRDACQKLTINFYNKSFLKIKEFSNTPNNDTNNQKTKKVKIKGSILLNERPYYFKFFIENPVRNNCILDQHNDLLIEGIGGSSSPTITYKKNSFSCLT